MNVRKDGDKFNGVVKSRWTGKDNVLELRDLSNVKNQTIQAMRAGVDDDRTAIQLHVKGASDGCLLCVGKNQFETKEKDAKIDDRDIKGNSSDSQAEFMKAIKAFLLEDKDNGHGQNIIIEFAKNAVEEVEDAVQKVIVNDESKMPPKKGKTENKK